MVCLADWRSFLLILPPAAVLLLSPAPDFQYLRHYRSATLIPFLFFATVMGVKRLQSVRWISPRLLRDYLAAVLVVNAAAWMTQPTLSNDFVMRPFKVTAHHRLGGALVREHVPPGASVAAQWDLYCQVPHREKLYLLADWRKAEYVFLDLKGGVGPTHPEAAIIKTILQRVPDPMQIVIHEDGYLVARRKRGT